MCIRMIRRAMRPAMKPRMIDQMMCNIGSVGRRDFTLGRSRLRRPDHVSVSSTSVDSFIGLGNIKALRFRRSGTRVFETGEETGKNSCQLSI